MTTREPSLRSDQSALYQIKVQGTLNPEWFRNFQGVTVQFEGEVTTLNGIVADQSALRGFLCYLWDFNLTVLLVRLVSMEDNM